MLTTACSLHAGGSLPFREDVAYAIERSPFAKTLSPLEFHPVATGERIGKGYPKLSGGPLGPYECFARMPGKESQPGVYDFRVVVSTKVTFFDEEGNETTAEDKAASKTELATGVEMVALSEGDRKIGDKDAEAVLLSEVIGGIENEVVENEIFYLNGKALRSGMKAMEVEAALKPAKIVRGKAEMQEATGDVIEMWEIESLDLSLAFVVDPEKKLKTLANISAGPGSKIETSRGIRIGSPESRVTAAYQDLINQRDSTPGETLIIGNMYLGLFVHIQKGKVASLYLGMGAE